MNFVNIVTLLMACLLIGCSDSNEIDISKLSDSNRIEVYLNKDEFGHIKTEQGITKFISRFVSKKDWQKINFNKAWKPLPTFHFYSDDLLKKSFWLVGTKLLTKENETYYCKEINQNFIDSLDAFTRENSTIQSFKVLKNGGS